MLKEPIYKISFLVDKNELKLLKEACLCGAGADKNIKNAVKEGDKYHIEFLCEELDDLAGYIASCANHEKSESKQHKWDKLFGKIDGLLELSKNLSHRIKHDAPKKYPQQMMYYTFDIWIEKQGCTQFPGKVLRKIRIPGSKSLYNFARVITGAFGFYFDHCFGFYDTLIDRANCKKAFELFVDIGEEPTNHIAKGVKNTKIAQAFEKPGEKMIFLFDYGDGWQFNFELKEIKHVPKWNLDPVILESIGEAPEQYPPCKDEPLDEENKAN